METSHTWRGIRTHGACGGTESRRRVWELWRRPILTGVPLVGYVQASSFTCSSVCLDAGTWKRERGWAITDVTTGPSCFSDMQPKRDKRDARDVSKSKRQTPNLSSPGRRQALVLRGAGDVGPAAPPPRAWHRHPWVPSPSALGLQNFGSNGFFSFK